jgi:hypothetical protein
VDGLASPYTGLWLVAVYWGNRTSMRCAGWSCCGGACREEKASRSIVIGWWLYPLLIPVYEIL